MRRRGALAIAVGLDRIVIDDGSTSSELQAIDGIPEPRALEELTRAWRTRRALVAVGPSLAQVRRVHGIASEMEAREAASLVSQNMEDVFVGATGTLTLLGCAREGDALWAWAVPTAWLHAFRTASRSARLRIEAIMPASRVTASDGGDGDRIMCVDERAIAVQRVAQGAVTQEWRARVESVPLASRATMPTLADSARTIARTDCATPLASPSPPARLALRRRRAVIVPLGIAAALFACALALPIVARHALLRTLHAERLQLEEDARRSADAHAALRLLASVEMGRAAHVSRSAPMLEALAAAARALDEESILESLAVDSATATMVVTTPSSAAFVDSLQHGGTFASVRISGEILRVLDDDSPAAPMPGPGAGLPVHLASSPPDEGDETGPQHLERVTVTASWRTRRPFDDGRRAAPMRPSSPVPQVARATAGGSEP
ncbi:MAG: hypothetical protein MUE41_09395 [Gemmatimonadaceae bacterium]|jgi:hypothetical protein|nr:hypothetical protein [Gemmatimonadaceae bacterium]